MYLGKIGLLEITGLVARVFELLLELTIPLDVEVVRPFM
jgi:hypothetical protein